MGLADIGARLGGPARGGACLRAIYVAEEPVRNVAHFLRIGPGGQDLKVGIDLAGVGVDDDPIRFPGERDGERALAAGGGSGNKRDARAGFA